MKEIHTPAIIVVQNHFLKVMAAFDALLLASLAYVQEKLW